MRKCINTDDVLRNYIVGELQNKCIECTDIAVNLIEDYMLPVCTCSITLVEFTMTVEFISLWIA